MEHAGEAVGPAWAVAIQNSAYAMAVRQSEWFYPAANLSHLLGLVLLVGSMVLLDLRLLGLARRLPAAGLAAYLTPFAVAGLVLMLASGATLFSADAGPLAANPVFGIKMLIVALAVVNAVAFRALWQRRLAGWDQGAPVVARGQALASLMLWLSAGTAGRLIAYF